MADNQEPLIDFSIIEPHKENIQSLPSGRSAKQLAALYSPPLTSRPSPSTTHSDNDEHAGTRAAFEAEVASAHEADDPLDAWVRYVAWTQSTYPSGGSTGNEGLAQLLERATRGFLGDARYRDDPRYLRLWLQYVSRYSDAPREAYIFLARQGVGAGLALFYEEFAAWLEAQGRWSQAEEVYSRGLENGARPAERLGRKFDEFRRRRELVPAEVAGRPDSPALPAVRTVLGQKVDPYASAADVQQAREEAGAKEAKAKKKKMEIFADSGEGKESVLGSQDGLSWDGIGTLQSRKKENAAEATSWAGQTLKVGKTNAGVEKLKVFKVSNAVPLHTIMTLKRQGLIRPAPGVQSSSMTTSESKGRRAASSKHQDQSAINPRTGRREVVYVNLDVVCHSAGRRHVEASFEEVMARHRGWLEKDWRAERRARREQEIRKKLDSPEKKSRKKGFEIFHDLEDGAAKGRETQSAPIQHENVPIRLHILYDENNENAPPRTAKSKEEDIAKRMRKEERANRTRKIKVMEVRQEKKETQTVQLNLASPTGPKIRRKKTAEPTMTINTKEAMDEIYGMFNQPVEDKIEEEDEPEDSDDDYTSGAESTATGRMSATVSEYGDETRREILEAQGTLPRSQEGEVDEEQEATDTDGRTEVTGWSDFTMSKHVPPGGSGSESEAAKMARLQIFQDDDNTPAEASLHQEEGLVTPLDDSSPPETRYIPLPPEDYEPNNGTYRDRAVMANNRLPFMTPIAEQTESSIGTSRSEKNKDYFGTKTPSRQTQQEIHPILEGDDEGSLLSSPFQEQVMEAANGKRALLQPSKAKMNGVVAVKASSAVDKPAVQVEMAAATHAGPIITEQQINPCDPTVRDAILSRMRPALSSYTGFHDHRGEEYGRVGEIKRYAKATAKSASSAPPLPALTFPGTTSTYTIKRELGAGAFAPVYLVERQCTSDDATDEAAAPPPTTFAEQPSRSTLEAVKMETAPPSAWEYHMIQLTHRRLNGTRPAASMVQAHECHVYRDASFLVEGYSDNGTLLDLVNLSRGIEGCNGGAGAGLEEGVAMFFAVELLRLVEALHARGVVHGDLKADNVMLRVPPLSEEWSAEYRADGGAGWDGHGVTLIDFGRAIDMRAFRPDVRFEADWPTSEADCVEMRELRTWTHQVDYHGLAGTVHTLLHGRYMAVVPDRNGAATVAGADDTRGMAAAKRWRPRDSCKRYWQADIWNDFFGLLLNAAHRDTVAGEDGGKMPLLRGMAAVRSRMERWLEGGDGGLKARLRRLEEAAVAARRVRR